MKQVESAKEKPRLASKQLLHCFLNRHGIVIFNLILLVVLVSSVAHMTGMLLDPKNDFDAMERALDGIATIFVAYGVVLEERESLLKIFRYYPRHISDLESRVDHICHDCGVLLLVLGLLAEMATELVKIPDSIINTANLENPIFSIGILTLMGGGYYIVSACWKLLAAGAQERDRATHSVC